MYIWSLLILSGRIFGQKVDKMSILQLCRPASFPSDVFTSDPKMSQSTYCHDCDTLRKKSKFCILLSLWLCKGSFFSSLLVWIKCKNDLFENLLSTKSQVAVVCWNTWKLMCARMSIQFLFSGIFWLCASQLEPGDIFLIMRVSIGVQFQITCLCYYCFLCTTS